VDINKVLNMLGHRFTSDVASGLDFLSDISTWEVAAGL